MNAILKWKSVSFFHIIYTFALILFIELILLSVVFVFTGNSFSLFFDKFWMFLLVIPVLTGLVFSFSIRRAEILIETDEAYSLVPRVKTIIKRKWTLKEEAKSQGHFVYYRNNFIRRILMLRRPEISVKIQNDKLQLIAVNSYAKGIQQSLKRNPDFDDIQIQTV